MATDSDAARAAVLVGPAHLTDRGRDLVDRAALQRGRDGQRGRMSLSFSFGSQLPFLNRPAITTVVIAGVLFEHLICNQTFGNKFASGAF